MGESEDEPQDGSTGEFRGDDRLDEISLLIEGWGQLLQRRLSHDQDV